MNQRITRITDAAPRTRAGRRRRRSLPRSRRLGRRLPHRRAWRILLLAVVILSAMGMAGVVAVYAAYQAYRSSLPDAATLAAMEPPVDSHVYDRKGNLIAILHDEGNRHEHVALQDVSRWARLATVDVEDRHFYEHSSWDLPRIIKAGIDNLRGNSAAGGASTITEQLAKISFLCESSCERSYDRKIKQVILGIEIENNFSKDQILEMYLNRISYGNHAIGIESAAQTYFHKSAKDLDLAEAAMLAGLPNSPGTLYPLDHAPGQTVNPLAKDRQRVVLAAMVNNGDITQAQADAADAETLTFHPFYDSEPSDPALSGFVQYVRDYLDQKFGDAYIRPGGWEITTSLDPARQAAAEKAVHDGVKSVYSLNAHDGALVAMDPRTGELLALVSAWDPNNAGVGQLPMATTPLQPGSTIKLFTYTAAIASREFTMRTPIVDGPISLPIPGQAPYSPKNYDRRYHGTCVVATCLGNSLNIPAVKVEAKVGIPFITDLEIAAGLRSLAQPGNRPAPYQYSATLGGLEVSPLELADGVSTIASLGIQHDPAPVLKVVQRSDGRVLYAHDPHAEGHRVVPENVAFIMSEITSNDRNRVMEFGARGALTLPDRRVSAKTGTTEFFSSNWTVGWTPDIATVVWVGNPDPSCLAGTDVATLQAKMRNRVLYPDQRVDDPYSPKDLAAYGLKPKNDHCGHLEGSTGITGAAPIWNSFMKEALKGVDPKSWYQRPADIIASGPGDDADFSIPGTATLGTEGCWYYGPVPEPGNRCTYLGTTATVPKPTPEPQKSPAPGAPPTPPPSPPPG